MRRCFRVAFPCLQFHPANVALERENVRNGKRFGGGAQKSINCTNFHVWSERSLNLFFITSRFHSAEKDVMFDQVWLGARSSGLNLLALVVSLFLPSLMGGKTEGSYFLKAPPRDAIFLAELVHKFLEQIVSVALFRWPHDQLTLF